MAEGWPEDCAHYVPNFVSAVPGAPLPRRDFDVPDGAPLMLAAVPEHDWLMRSLFAYDLVGFQSEADVSHFARYVGTETGADVLGEHEFRAFGKTLQVQAFPIGIDVDEFVELGKAREAQEMHTQMKVCISPSTVAQAPRRVRP